MIHADTGVVRPKGGPPRLVSREPEAAADRPSGMRLVSMATLSLAAILVVGCTAPASDQQAGSTGQTGTPRATPTVASTPPGPGPSATPAPSRGTGTTATPGDDRQGDLVRGRRTLTGTVARQGTCTTLDTGDARWQLTGPVADKLTPGNRVTVVGQPRRGAMGCSTIALEVATVRPA
jgi:hypothetical protein